MPFYKITVLVRPATYPGKDREITVVRMYKEWDIDKLWHILESKATEKWGAALKKFNCVQISKRSADFHLFLHQQAPPSDQASPGPSSDNPPEDPQQDKFPSRSSGPGKYRAKK